MNDTRHTETASPKWQHDCERCTYLGATPDIDGAQLDLYICAQQKIPTVIARYGHEGHQYFSGIQVAENDPHLFEAKRRAIAKGLLPDEENSRG